MCVCVCLSVPRHNSCPPGVATHGWLWLRGRGWWEPAMVPQCEGFARVFGECWASGRAQAAQSPSPPLAPDQGKVVGRGRRDLG